jgi:predicted lipid-binding transport protein (Tim44 family)
LSLNEAFDPTLLVFAALAVFVLWKLHSVLGIRSERDIPAPPSSIANRGQGFPSAPRPGPAPAELRVLDEDRWKGLAERGSKAWAGLDAIGEADRNFTGPRFIEGARKAYEMIVTAFAKGDRDTLRRLLAPEVFDNFAGAISAREARGETQETAVVSIDSATVEDARAETGSNSVTVRFAVKLLSATRNAAGEVVDGGLDRPSVTVDLWTFARAPLASDPNWKLVATESTH